MNRQRPLNFFHRLGSGHPLALLCLLVFQAPALLAEDGYRLWMRYEPVTDHAVRQEYASAIQRIVLQSDSVTARAAREELVLGLRGLLGKEIEVSEELTRDDSLLIGTSTSPDVQASGLGAELAALGEEGFLIKAGHVEGKRCLILAANSDRGVLYGVFDLLRRMQTHQSLAAVSLTSKPRIARRLLNHWDNLDRTVERGYAGFSLWDWHKLPDYLDPRYRDYARANASIGINGTSLNNVNANPLSLTRDYLLKAATLADVFRPYGIRVYLSIKFSAPMTLGGLETADPLEPRVAAWWKDKAEEIYSIIPDFGGFLVKANSEGQPGPQDYNRSHGEGANMLADALAPHGGVVIWRAFVYDNNVPVDRAKQAYNEFTPLDGTFRPNVLIQVKNGPIDFQPREPFHPLFGAMPETPLMMEFQVTKEYLGFATHLAYLAPLFKEAFDSDTFARGAGSTVSKVVDGSLEGHSLSGISGVANIGTDRNWTGGTFTQADWYAYGRLAWDHTLDAGAIAEEWIRQTLTNDPGTIGTIKEMMLASREAAVNYMTPIGLHHLMARGHHYGPGPWVEGGRADWTSVYYHRADNEGIGFDRTASGSDALGQYRKEVQALYADPFVCPPEYLLWFHHVSWDFKLKSGRTVWEELCYRYNLGVDQVRQIQQDWETVRGHIDSERFDQVAAYLKIQLNEAKWWRDACLLYFQTFSGKAIPDEFAQPAARLEELMKIDHPFAPGH